MTRELTGVVRNVKRAAHFTRVVENKSEPVTMFTLETRKGNYPLGLKGHDCELTDGDMINANVSLLYTVGHRETENGTVEPDLVEKYSFVETK